MAILPPILFWGLVLFGVGVAASYVGAMLALRSYFGDEEFGVGDVIRFGDDDQL